MVRSLIPVSPAKIRMCAIFLLLAHITGCSKDPISSSSVTPAKRLVVIPDTLHGLQYTPYTFRGRVDGVPDGNAYLNWDFGPAVVNPIDTHWRVGLDLSNIVFSRSGRFSVHVEARDNFNDTLLAATTIPVTIDSSIRTVKISSGNVDTTGSTALSGAWNGSIMCYPSITGAVDRLDFRYLWRIHRPDGSDTTFIDRYGSTQYIGLSAGVTNVRLDVLDGQLAPFGSDSVVLRLTPIAPKPSDIATLRTVTIFYQPDDSLRTVLNKLGQPTVITHSFDPSISTTSVSIGKSQITANDEASKYLNLQAHLVNWHDHLSATLSSDLRTMTVNMDSKDTEYFGFTTSDEAHYRCWGGAGMTLHYIGSSSLGLLYGVSGVPSASISPQLFVNASGGAIDDLVNSTASKLTTISSVFQGGRSSQSFVFVLLSP